VYYLKNKIHHSSEPYVVFRGLRFEAADGVFSVQFQLLYAVWLIFVHELFKKTPPNYQWLFAACMPP